MSVSRCHLLGERLLGVVRDVLFGRAVGNLRGTGDTGTLSARVGEVHPGVFVVQHPSNDGLTVCLRELTAERERKLELQRSQQLFESVIHETEDATVADTDRRITESSPAAERLSGTTRPRPSARSTVVVR
ncbi:hypothetical protein C9J85_19630 [Haloferax sp. wsp5]|nr:hypothetical protein C9J85_19630 [Haloferax sp. wsp5]